MLMVQRITGSCNGQEEDPQEEDQTSNFKTSIKASTFQEKKKSSKKRRRDSTTSSSTSSSSSDSSSPSSSASTSSTTSKKRSPEPVKKQPVYPSWSSKSPVCAGETYQDPKNGTIIRVVRVRTRSRLMDAVDTAKQQWSKKSFCCRDSSCRICADYCRTSRANLCLSVIGSTRKNDKPNGLLFKKIVNDILRKH